MSDIETAAVIGNLAEETGIGMEKPTNEEQATFQKSENTAKWMDDQTANAGNKRQEKPENLKKEKESMPELSYAEIAAGKSIWYRFWKRSFDIFASLVALVILSPILLITTIAIVIEDGRPVIYSQIRIGKDRRPFKIYKFRSMVKNADKIHEELRQEYEDTSVSFKPKDDPRITRTGNVIRKFNIDELPQLINILKGDMSFVGPRPLPDYEFEEEQKRYGNAYLTRYSVPQGLTCYWQISNRADVEFEDRMQMDVDYARNPSLHLDLILIVKTFLYTITGKAGY